MDARAALALLAAALPAAAQWSLPEVVRRAGEKNPGVRAAFEEAAAAAAGVNLARTAWLPKGDLLYQTNAATRNNVFGMLLPQRVIAPISGPPVAESRPSMVFGTAAGMLVSWEPFDLGQRAARLAAANASKELAQRAYERERFEMQAAAADAYISALAAAQLAVAARADLERARTLEAAAERLAAAGLRPEAEVSRARAERAAAEAALIQAEQAARTARTALAGVTGDEPDAVRLEAGKLLSAAAPALPPPGEHPRHAEARAAAEAAQALARTFDAAWRPKFEVQGALYGRGTGANFDQTRSGPPQGMYPNFYNWGAGITVTFPFLDRPAVRAQQQEQAHRAAAEAARLNKVELALRTQIETARAQLESAERLAAAAPVQLEAARAAHEQARVRFEAGLAGVMETAEAQRLLAQSEVNGALARLGVWRAMLALAAAQGDLAPFLEALER